MSTPCRLWASGVLSIRQQGAGLHGLGAPSQAWCVDRTAPRPAPAWSCHQGAAGPLESPRLWAAWPGREALAALHTWMDEGPRAPTGRWMTPLRTQLSHSATVRGEARRWDTMGELVTAGRKGLGLQTERGGRGCRKVWRGGEGRVRWKPWHRRALPLLDPSPGSLGAAGEASGPTKLARPGKGPGVAGGWGGRLRWVLGRDGGKFCPNLRGGRGGLS